MIAFRHGLLQPLGHRPNEIAILLRQRFILIIHQMICAKIDDLSQRFRQLNHVFLRELCRLFWESNRPAPQFKRAFIALGCLPVQVNRMHQSIMRQRHIARLPRRPQHHHVGKNAVTHQNTRQLACVEHRQPIPQTRLQGELQLITRNGEICILRELARYGFMAIHHGARPPGFGQAKRG